MSPEPSDPQDAQVAQMYINDRARFNQTAKYWTESYAMGKTHNDKIRHIVEMGFDEVSGVFAHGGAMRHLISPSQGSVPLSN